jgi:hypothetical protein
MSKKALLIGCNYYYTSYKLNGCIEDIINIRNILINVYGYNPSNIIMLHDSTDSTFIKSNGLPTYSNIINNLKSLVNASSSCSEIWFHYSGHGTYIKDMNGDETDGNDECIVPTDFKKSGFIVDDTILSIIKNIDVKCRAILLFDSCFSGTVCDLPYLFTSYPTYYKWEKSNKTEISNNQIYMFSGSNDNQTSADTYNYSDKKYVGAFTQALINCLKSSGYSANLLSLHRDICISLKNNGFTQIPLLSSTTNSPNCTLVPYVNPSIIVKNIMKSVIN